jgi:hypothetical protein
MLALTASLLLVPFRPPGVPAPGTQVDQTFEVALPASVEEPSLTFAFGAAEVAVSRALLETLVAENPTDWKSEEERQARIAAVRARDLLDHAGGKPGAVDGKTVGEGRYLLATLLQAGFATVRVQGSTAPARRLLVHYSGSSAGPMLGTGHITISVADPPAPLLFLSWFVR